MRSSYRINCDAVMFLDFEFAQSKNVEAKLWEAHGKLNSKFRKHLSSVSFTRSLYKGPY